MRHKSDSDCPKESSTELRHNLCKQSSDTTFDRGHNLRGNFKKLALSSVGSPLKEGVCEDSAESGDDSDEHCVEVESFPTRMARFAMGKLHRALSLGSSQHSPESTVGELGVYSLSLSPSLSPSLSLSLSLPLLPSPSLPLSLPLPLLVSLCPLTQYAYSRSPLQTRVYAIYHHTYTCYLYETSLS